MPWGNTDGIREELKELRESHQKAGDKLTNKVDERLTQLHHDNSDLRHDLNETLSGGLAELRHDNAQLRDQLTEALREGFGRVHAENLELRARLDRAVEHLAEARETILAMRAEAAEAQIPAPASAGDDGSGGAQPTATDSGDEQGDDYPAILRQAAGIAYANIDCHRDTWAFLVAQSANGEHFRLPSDVNSDAHGLIATELSGPTLIAVLDSLWHTKQAPETTAGTQALAEKIYDQITTALSAIRGADDNVDNDTRDVVSITIDDRT